MVRIFKTTAYYFAVGAIACASVSNATAIDKPNKLDDSNSLPKWEIGVGVGALNLPHYPSANQSQNIALAFPYFIYRGDILQASRSGIRTTFYNNGNWKIDLGFGGSLPVNSDDNDARQGMDDLDWVGEVGPRISYTAYQKNDHTLVFRLPIRAAFSTDFKDIDYQGWRATAEIKYHQEIGEKFNFSAKWRSTYSDQRFHDYFYGVDATEVDNSIGRHEYIGKAGYSGSGLSLSLGWRHKRWYVGAYSAIDSYTGVSYDDSPLFKQSHGLSAGGFVIWTFWHSDERVSRAHLVEEE